MLRIRRILFPTDFSESSNQALEHALFLAREHDAPIDVLHVIQLAPGYSEMGVPTLAANHKDEAKQQLLELLEAIEHDDVELRPVLEEGAGIGQTILEYASEHNVDLIVLGTHGRQGVRRFFLGSEAEEVLRGADQPVFAVRKQESAFPKTSVHRVLVPVDLSSRSAAALAHAQEIAATYDAQLDVVHVVDPDLRAASVYEELVDRPVETVSQIEPAVQKTLNTMARSAQKAGIDVHTHIGHGDPASYIAEFAETHAMDLIVLSSHGRSGVERFLVGSVAEKVMRTAPCPIFIVKSFGKLLVAHS